LNSRKEGIGKRVLGKLQSLYFNGRLFVNSRLGLPAQTREEMGIFKTVLDSVARNGGGRGSCMNIFE